MLNQKADFNIQMEDHITTVRTNTNNKSISVEAAIQDSDVNL
jgi:hypothetical protein